MDLQTKTRSVMNLSYIKTKPSAKQEEIFSINKKKRDAKRILVDDIDIHYLKTMAVIFFKIKISDLEGETRRWDIKVVRHFIMYIAFYNSKLTLNEIGYSLGNRDHSTINNGRDVTQDRLDTELETRKKYNEFINFLGLEKLQPVDKELGQYNY